MSIGSIEGQHRPWGRSGRSGGKAGSARRRFPTPGWTTALCVAREDQARGKSGRHGRCVSSSAAACRHKTAVHAPFNDLLLRGPHAAAEDGPPDVNDRIGQLQCSNKCLREGQAVGRSHCPATGDGRPSVDARRRELQCSNKCLQEGQAVGRSPSAAAEDGRPLTPNVVSCSAAISVQDLVRECSPQPTN